MRQKSGKCQGILKHCHREICIGSLKAKAVSNVSVFIQIISIYLKSYSYLRDSQILAPVTVSYLYAYLCDGPYFVVL